MELHKKLLLVRLGELTIAREWWLGNRYKADGYLFSFGMDFHPFSKERKRSLGLVPVRVRIVLGLILVAGVLLAIYTALTAKDSSLHLKLHHDFHGAQVSLWRYYLRQITLRRVTGD